MSIKTYILNASGNLNPYKNLIKETVQATLKQVQRRITLKNIDIVIREADRPELLKELNGVSGYCPSGYFAQLSIDTNHPSFSKSPKKNIAESLIHELHHAARWQAGINMDKSSFLECLLNEGLADYFVYEITGDLPKWTKTLKAQDRKRLMKRIKQIINKKMTYRDYEDWFIFGSKKRKIPRFAGYAIGLKIAKTFFEINPKKSASSLVKIPVKKFISGKNKKDENLFTIRALY